MQKLPEKLYLSRQIREMDRIAIEDRGILGIDLMRQAGIAVFEVIRGHYSNSKVIVFCGHGNNAGDGFVVARLALESGYKVEVYHLSKPENIQGDALIAYKDYIQAGGMTTKLAIKSDLTEGVIVDALLGTGLNREVSGYYEQAVSYINASSNPVISVDIPSGLNANTGSLMGCAVKADFTVSFIGLKQGMFTGFAAEYCGKIIFSSLNISEDIICRVDYSSKLLSQCALPKRHQCTHKGNNGHVLVVGGDDGYSGAIRLAAEAALRVGAGLVSVATRKNHSSYINNNRPELMCHGIEHSKELNSLLNKATVIVIGPGLGLSQWAKDLFQQLVDSDKSLIVDADGLNILANEGLYRNNWVLTPHHGEAARLLTCSTAEIANDRIDTVSKIQKKYGGVIVLKGAGTLIDCGKEISISTTGNPGMASAGMGDVLAGMIGGLIAQNISLPVATTSAVYIHGRAADLSAQQHGERGMLASDLMPFIRQLVNE